VCGFLEHTTLISSTGSVEGEIIERKCPSGRIIKVIKMNGRYRDLNFATSGFMPDPRTHAPSLRSMDVYENDILITAFPKCGKKTNVIFLRLRIQRFGCLA
jgi:hypothetical protein